MSYEGIDNNRIKIILQIVSFPSMSYEGIDNNRIKIILQVVSFPSMSYEGIDNNRIKIILQVVSFLDKNLNLSILSIYIYYRKLSINSNLFLYIALSPGTMFRVINYLILDSSFYSKFGAIICLDIYLVNLSLK